MSKHQGGIEDPVKHAIRCKKYNSRPEVRERQRLKYHQRKKDPIEHAKMLARWKARNHIKMDGPCKCGRPAIHRHHDDYSKPLAVRLLCQECHEKEHHLKFAKAAGEI